MGKKRKAGGKPYGETGLQEPGPSDSKLVIKSYEDVADSEDEFFINRDKILLDEGPAMKRQRRLEEDDEEVLAADSDEDEYDENNELASDYENTLKQPGRANGKDGRSPRSSSVASEEGEEEEGWGTSKRDYYNADVIETEADALEEEKEALRLQKKQLQAMTEADFGFDEGEWLDAGKSDAEVDSEHGEGVIREVLPQVVITAAMGVEERTKVMNTRYPEFELLAKEFVQLQAVHKELMSREISTESISNGITPTKATLSVRYSALSAYLAALSMYFALFTSGFDEDGKPIARPVASLRDHPLMETLIQCRTLWDKVKEFEDVELVEESIPDAHKYEQPQANGAHIKKTRNKAKRKPADQEIPKKEKKPRKSKAQLAAEAALLEADAQRAERLRRTEEALAKLNSIQYTPGKTLKTAKPAQKPPAAVKDDDSDFGEETSLTAQEAEEKAKRKRTLRFYTSQIAQKANKRDVAGRDAGGDADLPHRERFRDRQARLNAEAEARGKPQRGTAGEPLGGESDDEDRRAAKDMRNGGDDDDYYDLVTARSQKKKAEKAVLAAAHAQAAREGGLVRVVAETQADGKRGITYAIEKNKGLTPKRKKDVRNPRVKKRKKYDEKMKKLGSVRPVYKGGEGRGGYGGELTGIKKGLVRSVKL